jgi:hypothetical protein
MKVAYFLALFFLASLKLSLEAEKSNHDDAQDRASKLGGLRTVFEETVHSATRVDGKHNIWRFTNPGHGLDAVFGPEGVDFSVTSKCSDDITSSFKWRTRSIGYGEHSSLLPQGEVVLEDESNRLEIRRPGVVEWFVNSSHGLEQGYTILVRPEGPDKKSPLRVWFDVSGSFQATVSENTQQIVLRDSVKGITLHYDQLKSWDANGKILASRMISENGLVGLEVEEAEALYPITIDPIFTQVAYLKASNARDEAVFFGQSVSIDGNTAVVGAPGENSAATGVNGNQASNTKRGSGAAFVFIFNGTNWAQQAYLKASNTDAADWFGESVAISGNTIVVGAPDERGSSTSVNGPDNNNLIDAGAAYVFVRSGSTWSQQAYLKPSNINSSDNFGHSVAINGDTIIVGAPLEDGSATTVNGTDNNAATDAGSAYVFTRNGSAWSQQAYMKASNAESGDNFGFHVTISGDTAVIGSINEDGGATTINGTSNNGASGSGAAYVFSRSGTIWSQQAYLKPNNTGAGDNFGYRVALDGNTVAVGAPYEDSLSRGINANGADDMSTGAGAAYVFVRDNTNAWSQQAYLKASNADPNDNFGIGISISGDTVLVGASGEDSVARDIGGDQSDNSASGSGAAYCFSRAQSNWTQRAYVKASNTESGARSWDHFGNAVSISATLAIIGANDEHSNAIGINGNGFNNSIESAGAAYAFAVDIPPPAPQVSVFGNGIPIVKGASSTTMEDYTRFPATGATGETVFRDFTIKNVGDDTLTLSDEIALSGSQSFELIVAPETTIPPNGESVFVIAFTPNAQGIQKAVVSLRSNADAGSPFTFLIEGVGPEPLLSVTHGTRKVGSRGLIGFKATRVGQRSRPATLQLKNVGTAPLVGILVSIRGGSARDFRITRQAPSSVPPGAVGFVQISFSPSKKGKRSSLLEMRSNSANGSPFLLNISGKGK